MTSPCTVSLLWSGDGDSDQPVLSFRIWLNGRELNCSSRKVDLATNSLQVLKDPAENISLNQVGTYDVKVESFSRNIADVPFKVVVRRSGQEAEIYEGIWPRRAAKNLMDVCQVTVEPEDLFEQSPEAFEELPPRVSSPPPSAASGVATTPKFAFEDDGLATTLQAPANQRTFAFDPQRLPSSHRRLPAKVSGLAQPGEIQVPAKYRSEAPAPKKVFADAFPEDVEVSLPCTSWAQAASSPSPLRAASAPVPPWPQEDEFPPPTRQAAVAGRGAGRMTPEPGICPVQGSKATQGERPRSPAAGLELEAAADSLEGERRSKRRHRREGSRRSSRSSLPEFEGEGNDRRHAPMKSEVLPIADQADGSSLAASPPLSRRPSTEAETVDGRASDRSQRRSRRRQESDEQSQGVSERSERRRRRRQEDEETNATSESRRSHRSRRRRGEDEDAASEATSGGSRRRRDDEDRGSRSSRRRRRREAEAEELTEPGDSHRLARIREESSGGSPPGPTPAEEAAEITGAAISAAPQRLEMQTLAVPPLEAASMRQTSLLSSGSSDAKPQAAVDPTRMGAAKGGAMNMSLLKSYASSRSSTALPSSPGKSSSAATVSSRLTGARLNEVRRAEDAAMFEAEKRWEEEVDSIRRQAMRYSQGVRLRGPSFSMDRGDLILRPS